MPCAFEGIGARGSRRTAAPTQMAVFTRTGGEDRGMKIEIPEFALVLLVGASGTGKSSFAAKHFLPTETVSSDRDARLGRR